jgi:hypothetical protein
MPLCFHGRRFIYSWRETCSLVLGGTTLPPKKIFLRFRVRQIDIDADADVGATRRGYRSVETALN